jgi:hypothetical protein
MRANTATERRISTASRESMRLLTTILFASSMITMANPYSSVVLPGWYLAGEQVHIQISETNADITATFTFAPTHDKNGHLMVDLPVWLPVQGCGVVSNFWHMDWGTHQVEVTDANREVLDRMVAVNISANGRPLRFNRFMVIPPADNGKAKRRPDPGLFCIGLSFDLTREIVSNHVPVSVHYRQPLLIDSDGGRFFYLPTIPKRFLPWHNNQYVITIAADPGYELTVWNGTDKVAAGGGHTVLKPKHGRPIRAQVKRQTNKAAALRWQPKTAALRGGFATFYLIFSGQCAEWTAISRHSG